MARTESYDTWRKGFGPILHSSEAAELARALAATTACGEEALYRILIAAAAPPALQCGRWIT